MNITKAFCLSIALFGASNMQAITNSDFVIQQDNTKINNYQTNRPEASKRLFVSQAVEQQIAHIKQLLTNVRLAWMFENCFPNTLDTTVHFDGKDDTFVYTGDIHAMWLRDSGAQVWPYVQLANKDAKLKKMLAGVIKRQFKCINIDPYANAFNMNSEGGEWMSDLTDMKPELHERKWEIDSLCYPIRLAYHYWKTTGDASIFSDEWLTAIAKVLKTFKEQQRKEDPKGPYRFQRKTERALDTMTNDGWGNPVKPVGLIASAFRPSDDATTFQFLVPSNFFAVTSLRKAAEILNTVNKKPDLAKECTTLSNEVEAALKKYAVYNHPKYGKIYAFEVDGFGNQLLMDDATSSRRARLDIIRQAVDSGDDYAKALLSVEIGVSYEQFLILKEQALEENDIDLLTVVCENYDLCDVADPTDADVIECHIRLGDAYKEQIGRAHV